MISVPKQVRRFELGLGEQWSLGIREEGEDIPDKSSVKSQSAELKSARHVRAPYVNQLAC